MAKHDKMRELTQAEKCTRWAVVGLNLALFALGVTLVVFGSVMTNERKEVSSMNLSELSWVADVLLVIGCFLTVIALVGVVACIIKNTWVSWGYSGILAILIISQVVIGIICITKRQSIADKMATELEANWKSYSRTQKDSSVNK